MKRHAAGAQAASFPKPPTPSNSLGSIAGAARCTKPILLQSHMTRCCTFSPNAYSLSCEATTIALPVPILSVCHSMGEKHPPLLYSNTAIAFPSTLQNKSVRDPPPAPVVSALQTILGLSCLSAKLTGEMM